MSSFKPEGYASLSPYLIVDHAQELVDQLKGLFNATELRRFDRPDGTIAHVELMLDDTVLMLSQSTDEFPSYTAVLHMYVADARKTYAKAIELGFNPLQEPMHHEDDPDIRGAFLDCCGNHWSVGTAVRQ